MITMTTQSEELSGSIVTLLMAEKLLLEDDGAKLYPKIANGDMKDADWLLAAEKALEKEASK